MTLKWICIDKVFAVFNKIPFPKQLVSWYSYVNKSLKHKFYLLTLRLVTFLWLSLLDEFLVWEPLEPIQPIPWKDSTPQTNRSRIGLSVNTAPVKTRGVNDLNMTKPTDPDSIFVYRCCERLNPDSTGKLGKAPTKPKESHKPNANQNAPSEDKLRRRRKHWATQTLSERICSMD